MEKILLQRIPRGFWVGFWVGSSMEDPGVDSAMDSDSDLMMMDSGLDSGSIFYGGSWG